VSLTEDAYVKYFASDLPRAQARALYATQQPIAKDLFSGVTTAAAWRTKPSWYAVSRADQTTAPELERFLAKRMHATTIELDSGHLSLLSHPAEITDLILAAAGRAK
jgi:pimeloyl-ACP methyl ester carboxylesterase